MRTVFVTMFGSSGSSSRCASFQWAGDLPVGNASSMSFGKSCRQVCCMFRGWTRWTQLAMDPKYLVCILCLTMDTVTQIPDVIYDSWLETILLPNFWLYIYICICIWSVWKHFELIKFINADAYNPQEGGGGYNWPHPLWIDRWGDFCERQQRSEPKSLLISKLLLDQLSVLSVNVGCW